MSGNMTIIHGDFNGRISFSIRWIISDCNALHDHYDNMESCSYFRKNSGLIRVCLGTSTCDFAYCSVKIEVVVRAGNLHHENISMKSIPS